MKGLKGFFAFAAFLYVIVLMHYVSAVKAASLGKGRTPIEKLGPACSSTTTSGPAEE